MCPDGLRDPVTHAFNTSGWQKGLRGQVFAHHSDADCVNIGVFYMRSTASVSVWFETFLDWYHKHPYEIDQRGFNHFRQPIADMLNQTYGFWYGRR